MYVYDVCSAISFLLQLRTFEPRIITESNGTSMDVLRFVAHDSFPTVIPSQKINAENSKINQNKLIELLTARGGIAEVRENMILATQNVMLKISFSLLLILICNKLFKKYLLLFNVRLCLRKKIIS